MRVLIVEDNPVTQEALEEILALAGHRVDHAGDGHGALTRLAIHPVDVVVADYLMPGLDGIKMARRIRENPAWSRIPVILATAVATNEIPEADIERLGNVHLLRKPFESGELLSLIQRICPPLPEG